MSHISEGEVLNLLEWEELVLIIRNSFLEIKNGTTKMPQRLFMDIPEKPAAFLLMPCFSSVQNIITCKLVTIFPENSSRNASPTISAAICVFDGDDGHFLCTVAGTNITEWRTAAASIVATEYLYVRERSQYKDKTLAVLGTGKQGIIHIKGFQKYFNFGNIKIWNRTHEKALKISHELQRDEEINTSVETTVETCVKNADVVVVAFSETREVLLKYEYLKPGTFICLAGTASVYPSGVDLKIYQNSRLFTGSVAQANIEMKPFVESENLHFEEIGDVISDDNNSVTAAQRKGFVLFQSLGIAIMDNVAAKYVLGKYHQKRRNKQVGVSGLI